MTHPPTDAIVHADVARVIIPEHQLSARVQQMSDEIAAVYAGRENIGLTIVAVLSGAIIFLADLMRSLPMKMRMDVVSVSSYQGATTNSVQAVLHDRPLNVDGRDVLIVDDILDTGKTLRVVQAEVLRQGARSVRTIVLLRKPTKAPADVRADFIGFDIEDRFVVGYGLDYNGLYRNLPYVGVLKPEMYHPGAAAPGS